MMKIRLALPAGEHVVDVAIPQFQKLPDVIVLDERHFAFHAALRETEDDCAAEYREVFAYYIPPNIESEEK